MVEGEPQPKPRPGWVPWAIGVGVVAVAVGAFFVTKSIAGSGGSSPAAASTGNGSTSNGGSNFGSNGGAAGSGGFQGRLPGTAGQITAIDGTTLTVKDRQNQSVKVTISGSTRITIQKTVAVSDIAKGDRLSVTGKKSGTTIAASRISIMDLQLGGQGRRFQGGTTPGSGTGTNGPPNGFRRPGGFTGQGGPPPTDANGNPVGGTNLRLGGIAFGTVTKIDGGTITMSGFDGSTTTVTTSSSTTVTKSAPGALSDLKVGQNVRAVGSTGTDGTVAATAINEGTGGFGFFGGGRRGQGTP
jgi:hypothetical protein